MSCMARVQGACAMAAVAAIGWESSGASAPALAVPAAAGAVAQVDPSPARSSGLQAGERVAFRSGLVGTAGAGLLAAPLSDLPAPDDWIEVARKATSLRLDPTSEEFASLRASAESFRSALAARRERDWQPTYERISALMAVNAERGSGDDDATIALASDYSRDCVRASLADFDSECAAFVAALAKAIGTEGDSNVVERASRILWRTRATRFLRDPAPIPVPAIVTMSLRDEVADVPVDESKVQALEGALRAYETEWDAALRDMINAQARAFTNPDDTPRMLRGVSAMNDRMGDIDGRAIDAVSAHLKDPEFRWLRGVLVRRHPHAKEVIDAWLGIRRLIAPSMDPAMSANLRDAEATLRLQFEAMRSASREAWRADTVFGSTPSHAERAKYGPAMRAAAVRSQQCALALVASIDALAGVTKRGAEFARAVLLAVEPVTGPLPANALSARPISPDWPPRVGDRPQAPMLVP